ncbi:hypothetical protein PHMEG_00024852 [Phytophthora megakarya]|uniref:Uncharacterized protein n=1 Tax=Phytophthora megakarya TaxID=4795 RepID=A0A225VDF1_9STRA|nr:hypothetical protein PHMEG_00024852 [Phytophthora megakarya]
MEKITDLVEKNMDENEMKEAFQELRNERTVQVLRNKPKTSQGQAEQGIAVMQREVRDAYKYMLLHIL